MKKTLKSILHLVIYLLCIVNMQTLFEHNIIEAQIREFILLAEANGQVPITKSYMVSNKPSFAKDDVWAGSYGDINVIFEAIHPMVSFYVGGHAALIEDNSLSIETTGLEPRGMNKTKYRENDWGTRHNYVIGLRIKGASLNDYHEAVEYAKQTLGAPYDYSFLPFNKKLYCTEVILEAWDPLGYPLNYDGGLATIQDLIVSPFTYISYIHYIDKDGNKTVYYHDRLE